jgi:hypothetical protein
VVVGGDAADYFVTVAITKYFVRMITRLHQVNKCGGSTKSGAHRSFRRRPREYAEEGAAVRTHFSILELAVHI